MKIFNQNINKNLLFIKLHYFLYYGAEAGILPFLSVIAGQQQISASAVGVIFTILPFITLAAKPFFGSVADHLQKLKLMLILFIITLTLSYHCMYYIPKLFIKNEETNLNILLFCNTITSYFTLDDKYNLSCFHSALKNNYTECSMSCQPCNYLKNKTNIHKFENFTLLDFALCKQEHLQYSVSIENISDAFVITEAAWRSTSVNPVCFDERQFYCSMKCNISFTNCINNEEVIYKTPQFWLFFTFISVSWVSSGVITSLSDAACYELLDERNDLYGKQRLWGTIGWGVFSLFTGLLNDLITGDSPHKNYSASFYMLIALVVLDLIILIDSNIKNAKFSETSFKNVCMLFSQIRIVIFITTVFIIGALTGLQWSYFFWYMTDLKANQLIMGLALGVESFLGELPFFFFAGEIIKKLGYVNTISLTLFSFSIRYLLYSVINDPWLVLPVELLQGPTFGIFYAAMTSYANMMAPAGTEATMQGILGGIFEGLGIAAGSLLGGLNIDYNGSHDTFRKAGLIAILCCLLHVVINVILSCKKSSNIQSGERINNRESTSFL
ncbi:major facilitator superfamily domain-containing protein 6-like [Centruroides sculpturatus]|uniref:major facilitator superfamily domain-containing protein 6-like n=1 Tax=Centruroides sculpturatus TaxID=218467 RepID=UPI000C6EB328|nr:major facilitator superfamily domain-containing protein 6-like [Centruroides sculpturatus]XP_023211759.1 major facilitator superfamily domain-containing protein 6-like [Centruroides sculpturatus]XP_023211760.1 major facilitator superfamily domain-containing protein 6-like [Centruroides sculpturatus]XP_023211761.1 major facilitator superfamily domain-containing protein 6-like [Centruroides sculpturatus]